MIALGWIGILRAAAPVYAVVFIAEAGVFAPTTVQRRLVLVLFAINALLNILWSELFFHLRRPDWALIEAVPFWLSILALIVALNPISGAASRVLVPYLLWVAFATALNLAVVRLNGPFAA